MIENFEQMEKDYVIVCQLHTSRRLTLMVWLKEMIQTMHNKPVVHTVMAFDCKICQKDVLGVEKRGHRCACFPCLDFQRQKSSPHIFRFLHRSPPLSNIHAPTESGARVGERGGLHLHPTRCQALPSGFTEAPVQLSVERLSHSHSITPAALSTALVSFHRSLPRLPLPLRLPSTPP